MTAPSDVWFKQLGIIEFLVAENVKPADSLYAYACGL